MNYFEVDIHNPLKRSVKDRFSDTDKIMGPQSYERSDVSDCKVPTQVARVNKKFIGIFRPSADLTGRVVLSTSAKEIIERYRKENFQFIPCPILKGKTSLEGYWITNKLMFDDECIDFSQSIYRYRGGPHPAISKLQAMNEDEIELRFKGVEELLKFADQTDHLMASVIPSKMVIKEECDLHIINFKNIGIYNLIVSEPLKNELISEGLTTGVEFKPLEIPRQKWYGPNGLRKQFYK